MVRADHSSGCNFGGEQVELGGSPCGFILKAHDFAIYHAGDTNVHGDMETITDLYKPTHALIPIGGRATMGPDEAAFAIVKFLTSVSVVIPMHFGTFPLLTGTVEEFEKELEKWK